MKRLVWACGLLAVLGIPVTAHAQAEFDPALSGLRMTPGALRSYDFEVAEGLIGAELTTWTQIEGFSTLQRTKITSANQVGDRLTSSADAIEGAHALRLGDGNGFAITDESLFGQVKDGRFEVSFWARADGTFPTVQVIYDPDPKNIYGRTASFANVRAIRTGRETTDGWGEYSTGPLDGSVWGVPVRAVVFLPPSSPSPGAGALAQTFLIDALEIRSVDGKPVAPLACTQANVDAVCGAEGDCMYGHCVTSTVTWGANPPPAYREEMAERWIQYATRFLGDRNATKNGATILTPQARALAKTAVSSRQFFGGLNRLVNLLRDNHTSFGALANFSNFSPQVQGGSSSMMGACFGVVEKDIMGGGLGFAVFRAAAEPLSGTQLNVGDVLVEIDGMDPKAWADEVWPRYATTLPNDPRSDWGAMAGSLSSLITERASTVTLERCPLPSSCASEVRERITIDAGNIVYNALTNNLPVTSNNRFGCTQRFTNSVDARNNPGNSGEDAVLSEAAASGEIRVQFDGFVGADTWQNSMHSVFANGPAQVLMDARMGHGGYITTVEYLFNLLRGTDEPMGVFTVGRGSYDMADPPWLFPGFSNCTTSSGGEAWACIAGNATGFFATEAAPVGAKSKIAWLNTSDVSANDFMPRLLQKRSNFAIFAPHPTSGAFGSILELPAVASGWQNASLQITDSRFASSIVAAADARWESGRGVEPDFVVVQKLSDSLLGDDTILQAATAWLATP